MKSLLIKRTTGEDGAGHYSYWKIDNNHREYLQDHTIFGFSQNTWWIASAEGGNFAWHKIKHLAKVKAFSVLGISTEIEDFLNPPEDEFKYLIFNKLSGFVFRSKMVLESDFKAVQAGFFDIFVIQNNELYISCPSEDATLASFNEAKNLLKLPDLNEYYDKKRKILANIKILANNN